MLEDLARIPEILATSDYFWVNVLPYWVAFPIALVALRRWLRW